MKMIAFGVRIGKDDRGNPAYCRVAAVKCLPPDGMTGCDVEVLETRTPAIAQAIEQAMKQHGGPVVFDGDLDSRRFGKDVRMVLAAGTVIGPLREFVPSLDGIMKKEGPQK